MAKMRVLLETCVIAPSCFPGRMELIVGEKLKVSLDGSDPLWPATLIVTVVEIEKTYGGRIYTVQFDDGILNGGVPPTGDNFTDLQPYCCCEKMADNPPAAEDRGGIAASVVGCALALEHTSSSGRVEKLSGIGFTNYFILDPASSEHTALNSSSFTGLGLQGENPTSNGGIYLPADGGETRGTGPDFVKTITSENGCAVTHRIVTGRRAGKTAVVDRDFFSDTPRFQREDHPYYRTAAIPASVVQAAEVFRIQAGEAQDVALTIPRKGALNLSELHTARRLLLNDGVYRLSGCPDFWVVDLRNTNVSGRLGDCIAEDSTANFYTIDCRINLSAGELSYNFDPPTKYSVQLRRSSGKFDFVSVRSSGVALYSLTSSNLRIHGNAAESADNATAAIHFRDCENLEVNIHRVRGGQTGIYSMLNRKYRHSSHEIVSKGIAVRIEGGAADFQVDRIVHEAGSPSPVLSLLRSGVGTFYHSYIRQEDPAAPFAIDIEPLFSAKLIFHNCILRVANPAVTTVFRNGVNAEVWAYGNLITNASSIGTSPNLLIREGMVTLGAILPP